MVATSYMNYHAATRRPPPGGNWQGSSTMARLVPRLALGVAVVSLAAASGAVRTDAQGAADWPSTNYALSANRYSPLT
jgi:hypothetical protein